MTRDEIAKMAHEAGLANVPMSAGLESMRTDMWVRFAALVAAAEREACAKLCDDMTTGDRVSFDWERGTSDCAHAIRAKNQPPKNEP